jgi:phosphatidylglycerol:prolipoprotein diacylglycerol transferase
VPWIWLAVFAAVFVILVVRNFFLGEPYVGNLRVGSFEISPFGILVAAGVLFGIHLMRRWSNEKGLDWDALFGGVGWMLVVGFAGSHLTDVALYDPDDFTDMRVLLDFRTAYSSFGGFLAGGLAAAAYFRLKGLPMLPYMECTLYGFTGGWLFGRLGCFAVHDHPGTTTSLPFGIAMKDGVRHDVGFYELLFTIVLFAVLEATTRGPRRDGYVVALVATTYAPVRFALDFLRVRDELYAGLTPAQWACLPLLVVGLWYCRKLMVSDRSDEAPVDARRDEARPEAGYAQRRDRRSRSAPRRRRR